MKRFGICTIVVLTTIAFAARTPSKEPHQGAENPGEYILGT